MDHDDHNRTSGHRQPPARPSPPPVDPTRVTVSFLSRAGRWTMRLIVIFLFLQLGLWLFVGRKSLIQLAPDMIVDDVRSVALLAGEMRADSAYPERIYIIRDRLLHTIGEDRFFRLESSLGRFNGRLVSEDNGTYIERANQDGCGDCLFVAIRQTINTPFLAKSYTSYTRPLLFTQMHGIEQRSQEREHVYLWVLGRWIPLRTTWLAS